MKNAKINQSIKLIEERKKMFYENIWHPINKWLQLNNGQQRERNTSKTKDDEYVCVCV